MTPRQLCIYTSASYSYCQALIFTARFSLGNDCSNSCLAPMASWHLHLLPAHCFTNKALPSASSQITTNSSYWAPPYHEPVVDMFVAGNLSCSTQQKQEKTGVLPIILWEVLLSRCKMRTRNPDQTPKSGKVITRRTAKDNSSGSRQLTLDLLEFSDTGFFFNGLYAKDSRSIAGGETELLTFLLVLEAFKCKQITLINYFYLVFYCTSSA